MRIAIDIQTLLGPHRSGLYSLNVNLLAALERRRGAHRYEGFFAGEQQRSDVERVRAQFPGIAIRHFRLPGRPFNLRMRLGAIGRIAVFQYINSLRIPISTRRANVFFIPDISPITFPEWHVESIRGQWEDYFAVAGRHADRIVTSSDHTKSEVVARLGIDPNRISVVPLAAADDFVPAPADDRTTRHLADWGLRWKRYILSVGTLEPRKNHLLLLKAFKQLKERNQLDDHTLVLAGGRGWLYEPILNAIQDLGLADDVVLLGHADPLRVLYSGATMMVYPSLYEGFGLPPLEAMACGTPVIGSTASSLPEVIGEAGLLIDPTDPDDLARAMARVLSDSVLRERLAQDGRARAVGFSWDRTAALMEVVYEQAAGRR